MKYAVTPVLATGMATLLTLGVAGVAQADQPRAAARAAVGQVSIVQAVPDDDVSVTVDGRSVSSGAKVGSVVGPLALTPGSHTIEFTGGGMALTSDLNVAAGSSNDVVLHRPAAVGGDPVISSYTTPRKPIGPGKSRVLIAHTATVAPADVRLDGKVVFRNIANGEFATADVASGKHVVALLPTGLAKNPLLGPIEVSLKPRTVTMVYAVGNPDNDSMQVIAHVVGLRADGSVAPDTIDTGSAGLAAAVDVRPFGSGGPVGTPGGGQPVARWLALLTLVTLATGIAARVGARRRMRPAVRT